MEYILIGLFSLILIINIIILILIIKKKDSKGLDKEDVSKALDSNNKILLDRLEQDNKYLRDSFNNLNSSFNDLKELLNNKLDNIKQVLNDNFIQIMKESHSDNDKNRLELTRLIKDINDTLDKTIKDLNLNISSSLKDIRSDNNKKLDEINNVVSEKLDKTLGDRLKVSFDSVIEQITGVTKSIGEIKGIAGEVTSLKSILTNVKNKGTMGEVILGQIIKDALNSSQYEENVITKKGTSNRVEYAVKLPGVDDDYVYLPIDSKLPLNNYYRIKDAIEIGDSSSLKEARKDLANQIRECARDISNKYLDVPNTTDFGILFLPIEGLYIEALDLNLFDSIRNEFKVCLAGPTTLNAILNSLQLGFKTLAIQKKSADVFKLLGGVKTEFEKFGDILTKAQKKMDEASRNIDDLVGVRTRQIQSKLKNIDALNDDEAVKLIESE